MLPHFLRFEAISSLSPSPLWAAPASLPEGQLLKHNHAFWSNLSGLHPRPRDVPVVHLHGRTVYTFAAWFRDLTAGLPVHHNVPDYAWRAVLRFCTGGWLLCGVTARWQHGPATSGCPCCGRPPEDEMHVVLECPAYSDLRARHTSLFRNLPSDPELAMRSLFCPPHFRPLARFLRSCQARRASYVDGRRSLALPLELDLPLVVARPHVSFSAWSCLLVAGWLLVACFLGVSLFLVPRS